MQAILASILAYIFQFFTEKAVLLAYKVSIITLFVVTLTAVTYAYVSAAGTVITGISQTVPDIVSGVWGWVMPWNTSICLIAIMGVVISKFLFAQFVFILRAKTAISF